MIYPIIDLKTVGIPVRLVERNIAIRPEIGPVSDGIVFLVPLGDSKFMIDQRGCYYYNADGMARYDSYHPDRLEYLGSDRVQYSMGGDRISSIGPYHIYYDTIFKQITEVAGCIIRPDYSDDAKHLISYAGGVYLFYRFNSYKSRYDVYKIESCVFEYNSKGELDKIIYNGRLPGARNTPWGALNFSSTTTVNICYNYNGIITKIGSTPV